MDCMADESGRPAHLTVDDIEAYFHGGMRATRKLADSPQCLLVIDPQLEQMALRTPVRDTAAAPDVSMFDRISFDVVEVYGEVGEWFELTIESAGNRFEAYHVIADIVDLLVGGVAFRAAVTESLQSFKDILSKKQRLTEEQQVGLLGELTLLEFCVAELGIQPSLDAWLGAQGEEHDFVFPSFDVEIKSTRSEARVHMINSVTQLESSPGRPLFLLSLQFTAAGAARQGVSLADVINRLRRELGTQHRRVFDSELASVGWRDEDETLYPRRWVKRSAPTAYLADEAFPAITSSRLASVLPSPEHVVSVQYRLDVTQMVPSLAPHPIDRFCTEDAT